VKFGKVLFVLGTRPEAIKLAPLWHMVAKNKNYTDVRVCSTGQHNEMLCPVMAFFGMVADYELKLMERDQTLFRLTAAGIREMEHILEEAKPDLIFVQGDTSSAFIGALAGFYKKVKVAHVEAGLRTQRKYSPFPEEMNRVLVDHLSDYHFAPTKVARDNLAKENINKNVWVVGNTVVDALLFAVKKIRESGGIEEGIVSYFRCRLRDWESVFEKRIIFVTAHRRESFGAPFYEICEALREIARQFADVEIIYPVHLNPNVRKPVFDMLKEVDNIHLLDPLDYPQTVWLMGKSYLVVTDSGGIQEEAPSLGKPVLIMREVTERVEGIDAGTAILVGCKKERIVDAVGLLIQNRTAYEKMAKASNPYGDGRSSYEIVRILEAEE
jgi:UDP-N-acetylglucosamine 2-epimerase (non-hydrolysing)